MKTLAVFLAMALISLVAFFYISQKQPASEYIDHSILTADSIRFINMGRAMVNQDLQKLQMENQYLRNQFESNMLPSPCPDIDSIRNMLHLYKFKIERVKYYLNICLKNPNQDKFLKGWIRRAVQ